MLGLHCHLCLPKHLWRCLISISLPSMAHTPPSLVSNKSTAGWGECWVNKSNVSHWGKCMSPSVPTPPLIIPFSRKMWWKETSRQPDRADGASPCLINVSTQTDARSMLKESSAPIWACLGSLFPSSYITPVLIPSIHPSVSVAPASQDSELMDSVLDRSVGGNWQRGVGGVEGWQWL